MSHWKFGCILSRGRVNTGAHPGHTSDPGMGADISSEPLRVLDSDRCRLSFQLPVERALPFLNCHSLTHKGSPHRVTHAPHTGQEEAHPSLPGRKRAESAVVASQGPWLTGPFRNARGWSREYTGLGSRIPARLHDCPENLQKGRSPGPNLQNQNAKDQSNRSGV